MGVTVSDGRRQLSEMCTSCRASTIFDVGRRKARIQGQGLSFAHSYKFLPDLPLSNDEGVMKWAEEASLVVMSVTFRSHALDLAWMNTLYASMHSQRH